MTLRPHPLVPVLSSARPFRGRRIDLVQQRVRLPSGLELEVELVEHPGAVAVAALDQAGRMLLVRQFRPALGDWTLELPAGALEPGEDPVRAAARELEEETGHRAARLEAWTSIAPAPGFASEVVHLFGAVGLEAVQGGGAACDEDEELEVLWLPPSEVVALRPVDAKTLVAALMVLGGSIPGAP